MSLAKSLLIACSVLSVLAAPSTLLSKPFEDHVVHEERYSLPPGWVQRSNNLDKNRIISVRINLVQSNLGEKAEELLMSISHPESPKYGEHYNPHEIAELVRPFSPNWISILEANFVAVNLVRPEERHCRHRDRMAQGGRSRCSSQQEL